MSKKVVIPDAWDDDWETIADKPDSSSTKQDEQVTSQVSKAQLRAKHVEANKQIWDKAETPETFHFIEARNAVPLTSEFKPALKVLSRKPKPKAASRNGQAGDLAGLSLDDEDDSEEEGRRKKEAEFAERQRKAQQEREEKQRKYLEVRERLFGSSSPATTTKAPTAEAGPTIERRNSRSKRRNGTRNGRGTHASGSSADQSPARSPAPHRQLYDPSYTAKPTSIYVQRIESAQLRSSTASPVEEQTIRAPRGPDGSGRGGFGFAPRDAKGGAV